MSEARMLELDGNGGIRVGKSIQFNVFIQYDVMLPAHNTYKAQIHILKYTLAQHGESLIQMGGNQGEEKEKMLVSSIFPQ